MDSHHVARLHAQILLLQIPEAPDQQARAREQYHAESNLHHHQHAPQPRLPTGLRLSRSQRRSPWLLKRRQYPEQRGAQQGDDHREQNNPQIKSRSSKKRHARRSNGNEDAQQNLREYASSSGARDSQHDRLRQCLANQPSAARAQRRPHRQFPLARRATG